MRRTSILIVAIVAAMALVRGQQPAAPVKGSGILSGRVVDARGDGVEGAMVQLNGGLEAIALTTLSRELPGGPRRTLTASDGRFVLFDLPAGSYSIDVAKLGFLPGAYGRKRHGGPAQSLVLGEGERNTQIVIPVWEYASIAGTVVDEAGEAVVGVQVRSLRRVFEGGRSRFDAAGRLAITNDLGEYRIDALTPGEYVVAIVMTHTTLPMVLVEALEQARTAGAPASSSPIAQLSRASIPGGTTALAAMRSAGDWAWHSGSNRTALAIPDGTATGRVLVYPSTFFPGARSLRDAQPIVVGSGEERAGVNFQMQPVPTAPISGTIVGPDAAVAGLPVRLVHEYQQQLNSDTGFEAGVSVTDENGRFNFVGVPVGQYTLRATALPEGAVGAVANPSTFRGLWASVPLAVEEGGTRDLTVTLRTGASISGRMEFDGTTRPKPAPELVEKFMVRVESLEPDGLRSQASYRFPVDRNGQWTIREVPPGKYLMTFLAFAEDRRAMPGWETIGATYQGKDISTRPFDLQNDISGVVMRLTDHPSEISGAVRDANGRPDPGASVVLFSTERELWDSFGISNRRIRGVRVGENGTYNMRGIPAGEYFLAAIPDDDAGEWQTPRTMETLARTASRFTIQDGEKKSQDLTTRPVR